jgi:hypothetical protein
MGLRYLIWGGLLIAVGCDFSNSAEGLRDGDAELFAAEVQPIINRQCAFEGCHGREGMPLTLYGLNYLRLVDPEGDVDTGRTALDERALSETELDHNRRAIAARVSEEDPDGAGLIQRLVPLSAGGVPHADVVVYSDPNDPDIAVLRRFLRTVHEE